MAKKGSFELKYAAGSFTLTSAQFDNENIVALAVDPNLPIPDRYRVKWKNDAQSSDKGEAEGPGMPMLVGYVGHQNDPTPSITFRYGATYTFKVWVYSTRIGWANLTKWRRIKDPHTHTFQDPAAGQIKPPVLGAKKPDWLTPILNQMMA